MKKNKGLTFVEMLVSLILAAILILAVGTISSIGSNSHKKVVNETQVFNDINYAFKFLQTRVRSAKGFLVQNTAGSGNWISDSIMVDNQHMFGLYQTTGSPNIDFIYAEDKANLSDHDVLFSIPSSGSGTLNFSVVNKSLTVTFVGTKNKVPFNASTTITRRS